MIKLIIYQTGERFLMDGMSLSLHGGIIEREIDLSNATPDEVSALHSNIQNDTLIQSIQQRQKEVI